MRNRGRERPSALRRGAADRRAPADQLVQAKISEADPEQTSEKAKQNTFGEHLTDQTRAGRAESGANRRLAQAIGDSRQQQAG